MTVQGFVSKVLEIAASRPTYRLGHDGSDGECDCVGLIIGAMRRSGIRYSETHGSNWFARHHTQSLMRVTDADDLSLGDLVYKVRTPGADGYDLPSRYANDPDKYDYYHVGVVTGVDPLEITHCTSGGGVDGIATDKKLGQWLYKGQLSDISDTEEEPMQTAKVIAANGKPVNMRQKPNTTSNLIDRVPVGAEVQVRSHDEDWAQIGYKGNVGYMMAKFLELDAVAAPGDLEARVAELERRVAALEGGAAVG